jgi:serine/threonine-protein kinase
MRLINTASGPRTYENTAFGVSIQYPAVWGVVELKSSPLDITSRGSSVALFTAPLENVTDSFREKALLNIQDFSPTGEALERNLTLAEYTNSSLGGYRNISDSVTILESNVTSLAGQPAHRIVFTENFQGQQFKKTQTWTVNDNKAYVITFSAQEPGFNDYLPAVENMIASLQIDIPPSKVMTEKIPSGGRIWLQVTHHLLPLLVLDNFSQPNHLKTLLS